MVGGIAVLRSKDRGRHLPLRIGTAPLGSRACARPAVSGEALDLFQFRNWLIGAAVAINLVADQLRDVLNPRLQTQ